MRSVTALLRPRSCCDMNATTSASSSSASSNSNSNNTRLSRSKKLRSLKINYLVKLLEMAAFIWR